MPFSAVPPFLREPIYPLLLVACATALGDSILRRLPGGAQATRWERGMMAAATGLGVISSGLLAVALAGQLKPNVVLGCAVALLAATLPAQIRCGRALWEVIRSPEARETVRRNLPWLVPAGIVLALAAVGAMAPPTDPDGLYYQLTAPRRWLATGRLDYLATLPQTNLPAGVNLLFALAMATWSDIAAKTTHFAMGMLALGVLFAIGRRWIDTRSGVLLAALWLLGTAPIFALRVPDLFTYAYVDLGVSLECAAALLGWLLWRRTGGRRWFVAGALCAGFAASFKFTAILTGAGLAALSVWNLWREGAAPRKALGAGAVFFMLAIGPVVPWLARTWAVTGNPFYLMGSGVFPTRDWPAEAGAVFSEFFRTWVWGMGVTAGWGESTRKMVRLGAMAVVVLATLVHTARVRDPEARGLGVFAGVLILGSVVGTGLYLRYVLFALPVVWLLVLRHVGPWLRDRPTLRHAAAVLLAVDALIASRPLCAHMADDLTWLAGRMSRDTYLARRIETKPLSDFLNQELPKDAPILLAAGRNSYYIDAPCLVTEAYYQFAVRMDTWEHYREDLGRWGVRYVIASPGRTEKSYPGPRWPHADNEAGFIQRTLAEGATLVRRFGDDAVYELKPGFAATGVVR